MENLASLVSQTPKIVHIIDDWDAKAIAKNYYLDLNNSKDQIFLGINNNSTELGLLKSKGLILPRLDQTYIFDESSLRYIILDNSVVQGFSSKMLETYCNILSMMGVTLFEGEIVELKEYKMELDANGNINVRLVEASASVKKTKIEEFEKSISIRRVRPKSQNHTYEEIRDYIEQRGLMTDDTLTGRLEELRLHGRLEGDYNKRFKLTQNVESALEIAFKVSYSPVFKSNINFVTNCSTKTELDFSLNCKF